MLRFGLFALLFPALLSAAELSDQAAEILKQNCFACHGAALQMSKLDLRTRESVLRGGERGPAIVPHNVRTSLLYRFVSHREKPEMPPGGKLTDEEIDTLRRWIVAGGDLGTLTPEELDQKAALARLEARPISDKERSFWSFRSPARPKTPVVDEMPSDGSVIDAFLLAALNGKGFTSSPRADKRTLVRRAYLDLIGLPPGPEQVAAFLKDDSADAWPRLIDHLLASPHYGERWARHWLDLARYADSGGFERDFDWPQMWRYRDYVVDAFNNDKPYNRFVLEQVAGDEIAPDSPESNIATGFLRLGPDNNMKNELTRMDELDDILATTNLTFLGMTVQCARCHNHKFDPIAQQDYYRMQAVFFSTKLTDYPLVDEETVRAHEAEQKRIDDLQQPVKDRQTALLKPYRDRLLEELIAKQPDYIQHAWNTPPGERTEGQRLNVRQLEHTFESEYSDDKKVLPQATAEDKQQHARLQEQIDALKERRPEPYPTAMTIGEEGREAFPSYFLHRGSVGNKGSVMAPGILRVASRGEPEFHPAPEEAKSSYRRKVFAEWTASSDNPLTARVMVNRLWQHHFEEGLVRTPSNFGSTGQPPTHPELLDWLAVEFVESGWSIKHMHRLMMTSAAYRMRSADIEANVAVDPENRLIWRMPRQRLEAEILRDSILTVAGTLDRTIGGKSVFPYIDPDLFQSSTDRTWPGLPDDDPATWRRSLYVFSKRTIRYPLFEAFDQPDMITSVDRRNRSTVAPQALLLMNNRFINMQAELFAARVRNEAGTNPNDQVGRAFELALARPPTDYEGARAGAFVRGNPEEGLADLCRTLFNLNEFAYLQ